ncbi:hypothetical protein KCP76_09565 [Salmonella enterica subsp. enterica serovar Weltevreden]|nr:hypothetical protein KCP76_09565 [Salmonella enterica subsp. enterica serovar Weltevreden]
MRKIVKTADEFVRHPSCRVLIDVRQQSVMYQPLSFIDFCCGDAMHFRFGGSVLPDCRMSYQPQNSVIMDAYVAGTRR